MSDDMSDVFNNIKSMMDNGNLPDNIQEIVNNIKNSNTSNNTENNNSNSTSNNINMDLNKISPEMINTLSSLLNSTSNEKTSNNDTNSESSIDINTILKMKTIIESMNQKNDPRANLLYSLKPYLRENKKNKLDQYVNLLKMTKIADIMKNEKKENSSNA